MFWEVCLLGVGFLEFGQIYEGAAIDVRLIPDGFGGVH